jgi:hypothetical protein
MSDSPPGDQGAEQQDARAIHVDHAKGMLVGDHGTQNNSFSHVAKAGRDSFVAGRDQYLIHSEAARQCSCGIYAVGACRVCGLPECSEHGASLDGVFLCGTHLQEQQQANEVRQVRAAPERKQGSPAMGDGSAPGHGSDADTEGRSRWGQVAGIAAVVGLLAAGVVGLIVLLPRVPPIGHAGTLASYSFAPQYDANGLVIQRNWTISQRGTTTFTESITAANTTGSPITEPFTEPVPPVITADLLSTHFSPEMPDILDLGHAISWTLKVPAYERIVLSYDVPVTDPDVNPVSQGVWAGRFLTQEASAINTAAPRK